MPETMGTLASGALSDAQMATDLLCPLTDHLQSLSVADITMIEPSRSQLLYPYSADSQNPNDKAPSQQPVELLSTQRGSLKTIESFPHLRRGGR